MTDSKHREALAELVSQHAYDTGWRCSCGWTGTPDEYDTHLADALAPVLAQIQAEAERKGAAAAKDAAILALADKWRAEADRAAARSTSDSNAYLRMTIYERAERETRALLRPIPPAADQEANHD